MVLPLLSILHLLNLSKTTSLAQWKSLGICNLIFFFYFILFSVYDKFV